MPENLLRAALRNLRSDNVVYSLSGVHDLNTGIILALLTIAFLKSRARNIEPGLATATLLVFVTSILPTPFHGTGVPGILTLVLCYAYLYRTWSEFDTDNREIPVLVLASLMLIILNVLIGLYAAGYLAGCIAAYLPEYSTYSTGYFTGCPSAIGLFGGGN